MISEVIFLFLMYYAFGLLLAVYFFRAEELWNQHPSELGAAVVAAAFLFNIFWPLVIVALAMSSMFPRRRRVVMMSGRDFGLSTSTQRNER